MLMCVFVFVVVVGVESVLVFVVLFGVCEGVNEVCVMCVSVGFCFDCVCDEMMR